MSTNPSGPPRWTTPEWRELTTEWITTTLADRGIAVTGPIEEARARFWSVHLTVPTDAGRFWFKENCSAQSFEAGLLARLAPVVGDRILEVTAVEDKEGWLLTPDQGRNLWDAGKAADVATQLRLLTDYGQLQRGLMADDLDLTACGVTTMDPLSAADYLSAHVERLSGLPKDDAGRLDHETAERLRRLRPAVVEWAETVATTGLPLTLEHSDLHLGNAFEGAAGAPLRIFDFGDAVRAFPLCSALVPLRTMTATGEGMPNLDQKAVDAVINGYLEVFSDLAPLGQLRDALPAALELAKLNRHESWRRALVGADATTYAEDGDAPAAWLGMLDSG